jgi:type I restriction enzyme R subunit
LRATAELNETVVAAAHVNSFENFSTFFARVIEELSIDRMEGNEDIFNKVMSDPSFRTIVQAHLAREVYDRVRRPPSANVDG